MTTRTLAAALIAALVGLIAGAAVVGAAILLYDRLFAGSSPLLYVMAALAAAIGAYAGWLLALVVFSGLRSPEGEELETPH